MYLRGTWKSRAF